MATGPGAWSQVMWRKPSVEGCNRARLQQPLEAFRLLRLGLVNKRGRV